jgi:hypothetical protein
MPALYPILAEAVLLLHFSFILFALFGALLVRRWPRLGWLHLPAAGWAALVHLGRWVCPLTPLENWLRTAAGQAGYQGGFVEYYILPLVYPRIMTSALQDAAGIAVLVWNGLLYLWIFSRWRRRSGSSGKER